MSRYSVGTYRPSVRTSIGIRTSTLRSSQLGRSSISYLTPKRVSTTVSNLATAFKDVARVDGSVSMRDSFLNFSSDIASKYPSFLATTQEPYLGKLRLLMSCLF